MTTQWIVRGFDRTTHSQVEAHTLPPTATDELAATLQITDLNTFGVFDIPDEAWEQLQRLLQRPLRRDLDYQLDAETQVLPYVGDEETPFLQTLLVRPTDFLGNDADLNPGLSDLGFLVEAATVYDKVVLVANPGVIKSFLSDATRDLFVELLSDGLIEAIYQPNFLAVATQARGAHAEHHFQLVERQDASLISFVRETLMPTFGKHGKTARFAQRVDRLIKTQRWGRDVPELALAEASRMGLSAVASVVLRHLAPEYRQPDDLSWGLVQDKDGFRVETNVDLTAANAVYRRRVPASHSTLNEAWLLVQYYAAMGDLSLISKTPMAAIATGDVYGEILRPFLYARASDAGLAVHAEPFSAPGPDLRSIVNKSISSRTVVDLRLARAARRIREEYERPRAIGSAARDYLSRLSTMGNSMGLATKMLTWQLMRRVSEAATGGLPVGRDMRNVARTILQNDSGDEFIARRAA